MKLQDIQIGTEIKVTGDTFRFKKKLKSGGLRWDGDGWVGELTTTLRHQLGGWDGIEVTTDVSIPYPTETDIYKDWSDNPNSKY